MMKLYKKKWLLFIRILTTLLLLLFILEPIGRFTIHKDPTLVILMDSSKSMQIVTNKINKLINDIKANKWSYKTELLSFDETVKALKLPFTPEGNKTDIGNALLFPKEASAILLVSDGNNNTGKDPIEISKNLSIPVYCLGIGEKIKDLKISDIITNSIAYINDSVEIKVTFENRGFEQQNIQLLLEEEGKVLNHLPDSKAGVRQVKKVSLPPDGERKEVSFFVIPRSPGLHIYTIKILPLAQEIGKDNNSKKVPIRVLKKKIEVLYLSSSPSWNFKFAKKELEDDRNISLDYYIKVDKERYLTHYGFAKSITTNFLGYDLIIVENFEDSKLEEYVNKGGSLVTIGKTSKEISPFIFGQGSLKGKYKIELTESLHSIFSKKDLPPLKDIPKILGIKGGADILGEVQLPTNLIHKGKTIPVIALQHYGKGIVLGFALENIWQWCFYGEANFWSNLTRHFSKRREDKRIYIHTAPSYHAGEEIVFKGELYDEEYKPILHGEIKIKVGNQDVTLYPLGDGMYEGKIGFLPSGKYTYVAQGFNLANKKLIGETKGEFFVESPNLEEKDLGLNKILLNEIAEVSNGKYAENLDDFTFNLKPQKTIQELYLTKIPFSLILVLSLLSIEWFFLRK